MSMQNWWKRAALGGVAALTLAAGLAVAAMPAYAQEDAGRAFGPQAGFMQRGSRGHHGGFLGGGERGAYLAEALGISVEELEEAQRAAMAAGLADAVADGRITQEQADLMQAGAALRDYVDKEAVMASVLGVSVEEVEAARADGTLRDLMGDLDRATLRENMEAAMDAAVEQAVADGVITQEQADQLREVGDRFGPRGFDRSQGGRGFFRGGPDEAPAGEGL